MKKTAKLILMLTAFLGGLLASAAVASAQNLTFPYLANGDGVRFELTLTNPTPGVESGRVEFWSDQGAPMNVAFQGFNADGPIPFELSPGGALKLESRGVGPLAVGYAVVFSENASTLLQGSLVLTIASNEVSISPSRGHTRAHLYVEENARANTGIALANTGDQPVRVKLRLMDASGQLVTEMETEIPARTNRAEMFGQIFENVSGDFSGTVHATSDRQFHMVGLRQQRESLSISGLPNAPFAYPGTGSQLVFLADSGIRIDPLIHSETELDKSVFELTGLWQSQRPQMIQIRNTHPDRAVTLHLRFTNENCEEVLGFLLVLKCDQAITFDPFRFTLPGTGVGGPPIRTDQLLFGADGLMQAAPISARQFGTGRFLLTVTTVGAQLNGGNVAELLYPNEISTPGVCGMTTVNTGVVQGVSKENLSYCNAIPISFDYLAGTFHSTEQCAGRQLAADARIQGSTAFLRTLNRVSELCVRQTIPALCPAAKIMEGLQQASDCADAASVLTVTFDDEELSLMP
ncbi:MAG TPA: hypothetical protein VMN76_04765 [Acidobacteriota bacterium]|nr:hypothetical protein [Acidobacteriota bacterium]